MRNTARVGKYFPLGVMNQISEETARYCMVQERVKIAGFWSRQDTFCLLKLTPVIFSAALTVHRQAGQYHPVLLHPGLMMLK
jgi:hypothetical protein